MKTWLCVACGTQYPPAAEPPAACPICEDERQYVPEAGQQWLDWDELRASRTAVLKEDHGILGIGSEPDFAIGQRALLVESSEGNILWDCTALLDDEIASAIKARGGLQAIAISHPHYYTTMVEWASVFECPIYLHEADWKWVMRPDPAVRFWAGETHHLQKNLTLIRCGGHFEGGQVLHWAERAALLVGDIVQVVPDRRFVGFMFSYPNLIPLPASRVTAIGAALAPFSFDSIYGAWWGRVIARDAEAVVRRSVERYTRAVADPGLAS